MNPAVSQQFHLFCEQEHPQRHENTDKNPYCVYGTLKRFLQDGFGRSAAKKRCPGGDPRLMCGRHLLELLLLQTLHKRDLEVPFRSALFTLAYACARVPEISRSCTELGQEPCAGGATKVMTTTPKDITRIIPGLENAVLGTVPRII